MKKVFILLIVVNIYLFGDMLKDNIKNLIGDRSFAINRILIQDLIDKNKNILVNSKINYNILLKLLNYNGLLDTKLDKPSDINIVFKFNNVKVGYKNIKDILDFMGITYYNTKNIKKLGDNLSWQIVYRSDFILDPYIFNKELNRLDAKIINLHKTDLLWIYEIDFKDSKLIHSIFIPLNEEIKLNKPIKPYLLELEDGAKSIKVINHRLNRWFPKIIVYDKNLNILKKTIKDRYYIGIVAKLPKDTKYIIIDDKYNLINIKRGLKIIVR